MTKPMINCYACGTWIKPSKKSVYKCTKCGAKYKIIDGKMTRVYDSYKAYIDD